MLKYFFVIFIITVIFILNFFKNKISKNKLFILKTIFIIFFLEFTVFNINSYKTDFGNLKYIDFTEADLSELINYTTDNSQYVSLENINENVKTVYLQLDNLEKNQVVNYNLFYEDDSTSFRYLATKNYCENVDKTKYFSISLSRKM